MESGFATTPEPARRSRLTEWLERLQAILFASRVLPVTEAIAKRWGRLDGTRRLTGRPLGAPDGMIAATAPQHGLSVVTIDTRDFVGSGVAILNPWLDL